jgi:hypothetical protein
MNWILIAWAMTWGSNDAGTHTAQFNSEKACEDAGNLLHSSPVSKRAHWPWQFVCVTKGQESSLGEEDAAVLMAWASSGGYISIGTVTVDFYSVRDCEEAGMALQATFDGRRASGLDHEWQYVCARKVRADNLD